MAEGLGGLEYLYEYVLSGGALDLGFREENFPARFKGQWHEQAGCGPGPLTNDRREWP